MIDEMAREVVVALPSVRTPRFALVEKRLVDDAVVEKRLVPVAEVNERRGKIESAVVEVAVKVEARLFPSITSSPETENFLYGDVVPTPTFPVASTAIASVFPARMRSGFTVEFVPVWTRRRFPTPFALLFVESEKSSLAPVPVDQLKLVEFVPMLSERLPTGSESDDHDV